MTPNQYPLSLRFPRIDPAHAEVHVLVDPTPPDGGEIKGRIVGPQCHFAATVEVSYSLKPDKTGAFLGATIPEPCLWDLESPFLYLAIVEWHRAGRVVRREECRFAFRTMAVGPIGVRVNGRPVNLRGTRCSELSDAKAQAFREAGITLLLVDPTTDLTAANRYGLLVLSWRCQFMSHARAPSFLGHCFTPEQLESTASMRKPLLEKGLVGVELDNVPATPLAKEVAFVLCADKDLAKLADVALPKFVRTATPRDDMPPGVLAWIADEN